VNIIAFSAVLAAIKLNFQPLIKDQIFITFASALITEISVPHKTMQKLIRFEKKKRRSKKKLAVSGKFCNMKP